MPVIRHSDTMYIDTYVYMHIYVHERRYLQKSINNFAKPIVKNIILLEFNDLRLLKI